ncbi:hypothetical protein PTKU64_93620 (plasmid) [Paraburkholderia terrae]|uniref:PAAR domain-containing protein n=1 Tax=Paraburkholderia terrae TaxID=311230 RepID=A0ABM7UBK1_9BURK|nr:hypothetical protein PTKU64_93620 [Paraburkholderia terrae]
MAGAMDEACEVVLWVATLDVIEVSDLCLCGGEHYVRPADIAGLSMGRGTVSLDHGTYGKHCGCGAISIAGQFLRILGHQAGSRDWNPDGGNASA